jgi:hypothetical protein
VKHETRGGGERQRRGEPAFSGLIFVATMICLLMTALLSESESKVNIQDTRSERRSSGLSYYTWPNSTFHSNHGQKLIVPIQSL